MASRADSLKKRRDDVGSVAPAGCSGPRTPGTRRIMTFRQSAEKVPAAWTAGQEAGNCSPGPLRSGRGHRPRPGGQTRCISGSARNGTPFSTDREDFPARQAAGMLVQHLSEGAGDCCLCLWLSAMPLRLAANLSVAGLGSTGFALACLAGCFAVCALAAGVSWCAAPSWGKRRSWRGAR